MKYQPLVRTAAVVLAVAVSGPAALAQTTKPNPPVMVDTAPLPASERGSIGAIILEESPVLAQREAFQKAGERTGVASIGKGALRATMREALKNELAEARALERARLLDRGASSLEEK